MECGSQAAKGAKGRMWSSSRWLGVMTAGGGHTTGIQPRRMGMGTRAAQALKSHVGRTLCMKASPKRYNLDMSFQIVQIVMCCKCMQDRIFKLSGTLQKSMTA